MTPVMQRPDYAEITRLRAVVAAGRAMVRRACNADGQYRIFAEHTSVAEITRIAAAADRAALDLIPLLAAEDEFQARMQAVLR